MDVAMGVVALLPALCRVAAGQLTYSLKWPVRTFQGERAQFRRLGGRRSATYLRDRRRRISPL